MRGLVLSACMLFPAGSLNELTLSMKADCTFYSRSRFNTMLGLAWAGALKIEVDLLCTICRMLLGIGQFERCYGCSVHVFVGSYDSP